MCSVWGPLPGPSHSQGLQQEGLSPAVPNSSGASFRFIFKATFPHRCSKQEDRSKRLGPRQGPREWKHRRHDTSVSREHRSTFSNKSRQGKRLAGEGPWRHPASKPAPGRTQSARGDGAPGKQLTREFGCWFGNAPSIQGKSFRTGKLLLGWREEAGKLLDAYLQVNATAPD